MSASNKTWVNNQAPSVEDDDLNGFKLENNNLIIGSGQSLSPADNQQTHKAVAAYAAVGQFFTGAGAADVYTISAPTPRVAPAALEDGMRFRAIFGASNTGAATLNPFALGIENIKLQGGTTDPVAGDIAANVEAEFIYRSSGPFMELVNPQISNAVIGIGQTWQDVSGSRANNTNFTNTTGQTIVAHVTMTSSIASQVLTTTIDGVAMVATSATNIGFASSTVMIIPPGIVYKAAMPSFAIIATWAELRT